MGSADRIDLRSAAREIYTAALAAVDAERAVRSCCRLEHGVLAIRELKIKLGRFKRIYVMGAGKAAAAMARPLETLLGERLSGGLVIVKHGHLLPLKQIEVIEAGHPEPDRNGLAGAMRMRELAHTLGKRDLVIFLLSGGASALMPLPAEGISLEEKVELTRLLLRCGASIREINAVRKHISQIKGGRLAAMMRDTTVITLALSDVVGDDLGSIGSGPTVPDSSTFRDCLNILNKYRLLDRAPASIVRRLEAGARGLIDETPKPGNPCFARKRAIIIANNFLACSAAAAKARRLGFHTIILSSRIAGDTGEAALFHMAIAEEIDSNSIPVPPPACIISGGETTVVVKGNGLGGRNQEFVLRCAQSLSKFTRRVLVLSLGTDGTDGPTDAAGALLDKPLLSRALERKLDPAEHLERNDSYNFFKPIGGLIFTGPTGTNVMDLRLILIA